MRVAVLDKEKTCVDMLKRLIQKQYSVWKLFLYESPFSLVTAVCDELKGDLELLLIHIGSGKDENISVAHDLQKYYPHLKIIFYSQDNDCAEEIFMANPLTFLRLPFREDRLSEALTLADMVCEKERSQSLSILSRGQLIRIIYSTIRYVESDGRKQVFFTDNGSYETYMLMSEVTELLPKQFVQCHRSYIINLDRVMSFGADGLILGTGEMIPISRSHQKEMKTMLQNM